MKKGEFRQREVEYIQKYYTSQTDAEIGQFLNRSPKSIKDFRLRNNLPRPVKKAGKQKPQTKNTHADSFVYCGDGKPYRFVRVNTNAAGSWRKKCVKEQILKWEELHGPIPAGSFLRCKTKDTLNTNPSNWMLVNRQKQAELHRNPAKQAQTLKQTWDKVKIMEANGLKPRCGLKSKHTKPIRKENIVLHTINRHSDFNF